MRHRKIHNKGKYMREFYTGELVVVSKQEKSSRKYEDCKTFPTMSCRFWPEIITNNQDGMLGIMFQGRPSKVQNLLKNNQTYVW